ncbi:LysR substrate-binding domain-containing protein, partial [Stenotrophomonas sp.]|uniref:LysR substrate-binding domain-containing protein n=1 Tax=Stenotrophomonas sp. TaxID=69392 RepID=UPI0028B208F9
SDRAVQHGPESVDASIRIGAQLEDGLVARPLARIPFVFCASPAYLQAHGTPADPAALSGHRGLLHRFPTDGRPLRWGLLKDGQRVDAALPPSMVCD